MQLVRSHFNDGRYDFKLIEEDIVASYITGKSKIDDCSSKFRKVFHFKLQASEERNRIGEPTE